MNLFNMSNHETPSKIKCRVKSKRILKIKTKFWRPKIKKLKMDLSESLSLLAHSNIDCLTNRRSYRLAKAIETSTKANWKVSLWIELAVSGWHFLKDILIKL